MWLQAQINKENGYDDKESRASRKQKRGNNQELDRRITNLKQARELFMKQVLPRFSRPTAPGAAKTIKINMRATNYVSITKEESEPEERAARNEEKRKQNNS